MTTEKLFFLMWLISLFGGLIASFLLYVNNIISGRIITILYVVCILDCIYGLYKFQPASSVVTIKATCEVTK